MFCPTCGAEVPDGTQFCRQCGQAAAASHASATTPRPALVTAPPQPAPSRPLTPPGIGLMLAVGFVLGGFIGFLMRPSVMLIGQLPLGTVITRGSALSGLEQLAVPAAQQSFNVMVTGALIGAAGGFGLSRVLAKGGA